MPTPKSSTSIRPTELPIVYATCVKCGTESAEHRTRNRRGKIVAMNPCRLCINAGQTARRSPEQDAYHDMIQRCYNPRLKSFKNYGGRGITVCERWRVSFENFYADVGRRPGTGYSLERRENAGNYEPGNVYWATAVEQLNNTRRNHRIRWNDEDHTISQWARLRGIPKQVIRSRYVNLGWSPERTLTTPVLSRPYPRIEDRLTLPGHSNT